MMIGWMCACVSCVTESGVGSSFAGSSMEREDLEDPSALSASQQALVDQDERMREEASKEGGEMVSQRGNRYCQAICVPYL